MREEVPLDYNTIDPSCRFFISVMHTMYVIVIYLHIFVVNMLYKIVM